jgi:Uma2 family endonuclease
MSTTILKLSLAEHGRPMTLEEFEAASAAGGYHYELIDGKLYVSPLPDMPQVILERWIYTCLCRYSELRSDVINLVLPKARVFVPRLPRVTIPEPDVAAYQDVPLDIPLEELRWQDFSPVLVAEVLSASDPDKDLDRNVKLYHQVPSIREYWVIDSLQEGASRPHLLVFRRWGKRWREYHCAAGETYTTRLFPGFALVVDPRP